MEANIQIKLLETDEGYVPFEDWYDSLRDKVAKVRIRRRLDRLELGNFGDTESVGEGVYALGQTTLCLDGESLLDKVTG